jgi:hypothetical protein
MKKTAHFNIETGNCLIKYHLFGFCIYQRPATRVEALESLSYYQSRENQSRAETFAKLMSELRYGNRRQKINWPAKAAN